MKDAQKMHEEMQHMQSRLATSTVEGSSGGGMVTVVMAGDNAIKSVHLDPQIINPDDKEMLEDLIVAACNDAREKLSNLTQSEMSKMSAGLPLPPGFKMPF
jgi:DNA-binding YbaB/EbfC family protein